MVWKIEGDSIRKSSLSVAAQHIQLWSSYHSEACQNILKIQTLVNICSLSMTIAHNHLVESFVKL